MESRAGYHPSLSPHPPAKPHHQPQPPNQAPGGSSFGARPAAGDGGEVGSSCHLSLPDSSDGHPVPSPGAGSGRPIRQTSVAWLQNLCFPWALCGCCFSLGPVSAPSHPLGLGIMEDGGSFGCVWILGREKNKMFLLVLISV